ncbi:hypothetical protein MSG28_014227 [Choristoneura fumiferana]|uniref:Uncharacterized protein n=1 Tax=Choristoneura fumiferana TaxID=7141 RepID=A0ACC0JGF8_CHOFU|nr:hypothetical protein MSG28_014227 [Choristoneura fumiferana]
MEKYYFTIKKEEKKRRKISEEMAGRSGHLNGIPQKDVDKPIRENVDNLDTFDKLQRARYWVERGNIAAALHYVNSLQGASRMAAETWHRDAKSYLEIRQAAEAVLAHAAALGLHPFCLTTEQRSPPELQLHSAYCIKGSDHRLIRAKIILNAKLERYKLKKSKGNRIDPLRLRINGADYKTLLGEELLKIDSDTEDMDEFSDRLRSAVLETSQKVSYSPMTEKPNNINRRRIMNIGTEEMPDIDCDEIKKALSEIKNGKAASEDGILPEMLREGGDLLITNLAKLLNRCLLVIKMGKENQETEIGRRVRLGWAALARLDFAFRMNLTSRQKAPERRIDVIFGIEIVYGPESDKGYFSSRKNAQFPREQRAITEYHAGGAADKS